MKDSKPKSIIMERIADRIGIFNYHGIPKLYELQAAYPEIVFTVEKDDFTAFKDDGAHLIWLTGADNERLKEVQKKITRDKLNQEWKHKAAEYPCFRLEEEQDEG